MQTPASVYEPSPRVYPSRLPEVEYPDEMQVRTIKSHGHFRWKKHDVFLSEVLWGEPVGLLPVDDGYTPCTLRKCRLGCSQSGFCGSAARQKEGSTSCEFSEA